MMVLKVGLTVLFLSTFVINAQVPNFSGTWKGELTSAYGIVDISISLQQTDNDLRGYLSSSTSGASGIQLDSVSTEGRDLYFKIVSAQAIFLGTMNENNEIDGQWSQGAFNLPLKLFQQDKFKPSTPLVVRDQTPTAASGYVAEEVQFKNHLDSTVIAGTLTTPHGEGPFPAVILLGIAGPNDRDQTHSKGHKPFLVLADHLAKNGIATLRYDDRGTGFSEGNLYQSTFEDFKNDAIAALQFLKKLEKVDKGKIGYIGHSEGTIIGPKASLDPEVEVAFLVLLGPAGVSLNELTESRLTKMASRYNLQDSEKEEILKYMGEVTRVLKSGMNKLDTYSALNEITAERTFDKPGFPTQSYMLPADKEQRIQFFMTPWYKAQVSYDPKKYLPKIKVPVLSITGSLDMLQTPETNLPPIRNYLSQAPVEDYTILEIPGVNHLMQTAITGAPTEYGQLKETFAPTILELISTWILERK